LNADTLVRKNNSKLMTKELDSSRREILHAALVDMKLLGRSAVLPNPYSRRSGVLERSAVWFLVIPRPNGAELQIVAKFDEPDRAKKEWQRIEELRGLNTPPQALLPVAKNRKQHGVVVYQNANIPTPSGEVSTLQELLQCQLATNVNNCLKALDLCFDALRPFYLSEPGALRFIAGGRHLCWKDWLPKKAACRTAMLKGARQALPGLVEESRSLSLRH